jgi:hypothetical protein
MMVATSGLISRLVCIAKFCLGDCIHVVASRQPCIFSTFLDDRSWLTCSSDINFAISELPWEIARAYEPQRTVEK